MDPRINLPRQMALFYYFVSLEKFHDVPTSRRLVVMHGKCSSVEHMEKEASILLHATEKHDALWFISCTRHEVRVWFEF
jgi:hypothetical protein